MAERVDSQGKEAVIGLGIVGGVVFVGWHFLSGLYHGVTDNGVFNKDPQEQVGEPPDQEDLATLSQCSRQGEFRLMEPDDNDPQSPAYISHALGYEAPVSIWAGELHCPAGTDAGRVAVNDVLCLAVSPIGQEGVASTHFAGGCPEP